jgi:hypothetical protein
LAAVRRAAERQRVPALAAYFGDAEPVGLDGDVLTVQFGSSQQFWLEFCDAPPRRRLLASALQSALGRPVELRFELSTGGPQWRDPQQDPTRTRALRAEIEAVRKDPTVAAAVKLFGGRIVHVDRS